MKSEVEALVKRLNSFEGVDGVDEENAINKCDVSSAKNSKALSLEKGSTLVTCVNDLPLKDHSKNQSINGSVNGSTGCEPLGSTVSDNSLKQASKHNPSETEAQKNKRYARNTALKCLSRREYSFLELQQKLKRFYSDELTQEVLTQLQKDDWQCDVRFAQMWVRSRANRGYGPTRIQQELKQKGVTADIALQAIIEQEDEKNWFDLAQEVYHKKYGRSACVDWKDKAKRLNFMRYRGFTNSHIQDLCVLSFSN